MVECLESDSDEACTPATSEETLRTLGAEQFANFSLRRRPGRATNLIDTHGSDSIERCSVKQHCRIHVLGRDSARGLENNFEESILEEVILSSKGREDLGRAHGVAEQGNCLLLSLVDKIYSSLQVIHTHFSPAEVPEFG